MEKIESVLILTATGVDFYQLLCVYTVWELDGLCCTFKLHLATSDPWFKVGPAMGLILKTASRQWCAKNKFFFELAVHLVSKKILNYLLHLTSDTN
jgi:hypothetical protein